ncbi:hypothetical protein VA7868_03163 [Vibrio aerogenes CECT 7868]|uniref:Response regulatory domain-containing protein n=1 Tax=Vibrio aerogenes CECT 7868 TaxID=1216006 RepID=A0A1M5ZT24_9VIBR|nr:hypothetical protein [Vibrio aerogenes]SHI27256.1 hypothetical protein VA7868_03163 [Vibrio aerogenes CECT 7868]
MSEEKYQYNTDASETVALFTPDKNEIALYCDDFRRLDLNTDHVIAGDITQAIGWVKAHPVPSAMIVDIDGEAFPMEMLSDLYAVCGPTCKIITLGSAVNLDLYRSMLALGIFDYLLKPVTLDRLASTFASVKKGRIEEMPAGRTIAVTGVKGGIGTSTIAFGMAQVLAGDRRIATGLVDFDRTNGCLGLLAGLQEEAGLDGVLKSEHIDIRFLRRSMNRISDKLAILNQPPGYQSEQERVEQTQIFTLGATLCQMFNQVIWDLPSSQPEGTIDVLSCAQIRILVADFTVVSARNTRRLLQEIGDETDGQRVIIACNTHRENSQAIPREEFEQFIHRKVDVVLPYAGKVIDQILLKGALDISQLPAFQSSVAALVDLACGGRTAVRPKHRLLSRLKASLVRKAS